VSFGINYGKKRVLEKAGEKERKAERLKREKLKERK
jgi:hypothetical protein